MNKLDRRPESSTTSQHVASGAKRARARRLAIALSAALAPIPNLPAGTAFHELPHYFAPQTAPAEARGQPRAMQTWTVLNCSDHDPGSLRDIVENVAADGDTIDLGELPALCGAADSVITLTTGEITATQYTLTLVGPEPGTGTVTISGNGTSRVLNSAAPYHYGAMLTISDLAFTAGYVVQDGYAEGGCIRTLADVVLERVSITGCFAVSNTSDAAGGGIYAGILELTDSTVSGNTLRAAKIANGGGVWAGTLESNYSSIRNNTALSDAGSSFGGGASVFSFSVYHTTVDHNSAEYGSALNTRGYKPANIQNSTISGNTGRVAAVRVYAGGLNASAGYLRIANSTVAFNYSSQESAVGAVYFSAYHPFLNVTLESSIIADNTAGAAQLPADVYIEPGHDLLGHNNLVVASNVSPPGVITLSSDPRLAPLADNGGPTLTHALLSDSPAIGSGDADVSFPNDPNVHDQRGPAYPRWRVVGGTPTTDMGAIQFDTLFADGFD